MLSLGDDYTAVYTDNINVGTAKVNVIGLDDYSIFTSLVKFNMVGGENQNIDTQLPYSSLPDDEANQKNNDSVSNENSGGDSSTYISGSKLSNLHAVDKNTKDAKNSNGQNNPNNETETEQENSQKWYEVVFFAIMSFFNKIVEFFKAIFR